METKQVCRRWKNARKLSGVVQPTGPESITSVPKSTVDTRQETRIAWDGEAYTKEDFQQHYGVDNFLEIWTTAVREPREDIGWTPDKNPRLYTESSAATPAGPSPPQPCSESIVVPHAPDGYWHLCNDGYGETYEWVSFARSKPSVSSNAGLNSLQQNRAATQPAAASTGANTYAPPEPFPGARVLAEQLRQKSKEEMQRQLSPHRQDLELPSDCSTGAGHDHFRRASKPCKYLCRPGGCRSGCTPTKTYCHRYHRGECTKAHCKYAHS
jgi:hypothetical protein